MSTGTIFEGGYEVLSPLGAGAFGWVHRARQLSTGQNVALKILRSHEGRSPADAENQRQRFRREMRLCAALAHPHVVRLIDSGESRDGLLYAVFEYVPGSTLRQILEAEGRLEPGEALHLMTQVLDALACAHTQGIVHRDVKPDNIMVTQTGLRRYAKVLDFGLGGFTAGALPPEAARLTGSGEFMGTPSYASPEQLRGEPLSPRSDLYSWGLVLLECLTGEIAMSGRTPYATFMRQLGPEPVEIPAWLREQRLGRLLAAVTSKDPATRDMPERVLLEALESIQRSATPVVLGLEHGMPTAEGERRQVTVVSCDTTISRVDGGVVELDDLDSAMQAQQELYHRVARQSGQTFVRGEAGGFQVVLGYPKARENDARRAARLALQLVQTSRSASDALRAQRGLVVHVRIGIHSGLGIVRARALGSDGEARVEIVGAPATVAARLAERARAEEVLVTVETRALLREEMECEAAGEIAVPDRSAPLPCYRIVRPAPALDTFGRADEFPLVGRAGELAQLVELWARAEAGELGAVLLHGEAGIGKSRLVRELRRRVPAEACIACRCTAEGEGTPLHPIAAWLRTLPVPLEHLLGELGFDVPTTWPLFADLLELPLGEYRPLRHSPERQKELTFRALASLIVRLAPGRPVLFVVEDLHWADPTTRELIGVLLDEARTANLATPAQPSHLLLFTARPEFKPPWPADDVTTMPLPRLSRRDVASMIGAGRSAEKAVPRGVLDRIAERTDGVPLFVEELVHTLQLGDASVDATLAIPATLRELLTARLDALSPSAYETAQFAAALGREVGYSVLRAVVPKDEWVLRQDLMELVDARLLLARRSTEDEVYLFKHALIRDAAYESMLRITRQRVHHCIAAGLQARLASVGEQQPELLAHHLGEAGDLSASAEHWHRAGDRAFRRASYAEAVAHFERTLATLERLPETPARMQQEIETLTLLGTVHALTGGPSHPRVQDAFFRARTLSEAAGVEVSLKILGQLFAAYCVQGDPAALDALRPRFERLAAEADEPVALLTGLIGLATEGFWRGQHQETEALLARALPLYCTAEFRAFAETYGWDGGVYAPLYAMWNLAVMGRDDASVAEAMAAVEASCDPQAPALLDVFGMASAHLRRDLAAAEAQAERAIATSSEQRFFLLLAVAWCGHGLCVVQQGRHADGIAEIQQGISIMRIGGAATTLGYYLAYLAEAHLVAGQVAEGLAVTAEALERCRREIACVHEPELLRLEGELLRLAGDDGAAEERLRRAVALAGTRGARTWELRAAVSLGRLLRDRGDAAGARAVVQPVHDAFTGGVMLPDLQEAQALLGAGA